MIEEIVNEEKQRNENKKSQYPYGQHVVLVDNIAKASGLYPNFEEIKSKDKCLFDLLWNSSLNSNSFFLEDKNSLEVIREMNEIIKREYEFSKNDKEVTFYDLAKKF
ncbi:unnamed protein product, partial [Brachionus calyciflorus]